MGAILAAKATAATNPAPLRRAAGVAARLVSLRDP